MSGLMQSTEMQHEATEAQSIDAAPMSEVEIGAMFDGPEESVVEEQEDAKEETAPEAERKLRSARARDSPSRRRSASKSILRPSQSLA